VFTLFKSKSSLKQIGVQLLPSEIILVVPSENGAPPQVIQQAALEELQAEALKQLVEEHKLSGHLVNLVLSPQQYKSYLIDKPAVPQEELAEAAKWRVKDMLDYSVEDAVVGVFDYPEEALRGRKAQLNVRVAQTGTVASNLEVIRAAGLEPNEVGTADLALASVLISQVSDEAKVSVLLCLSDHYGMLVLVKNGQLYLAREFDFDFGALREPSQQERKLDQLTLEVQRSFDYFESQMGLAAPNLLNISAPDSSLPLANMIGGSLGVQVENFSLNALANDGGTPVNLLPLQSAMYAYGALHIPDNKDYSVNFYGEAFKPHVQPLSLPQLGLASAALLIVSLGIHFVLVDRLEEKKLEYSMSQNSLNELQQQVTDLAAKTQAMKIDQALQDKNGALQKEIEAYRALIGQLGSQQQELTFLYSDFFRSLAKHKPKKLWLTEFDVDSSMGHFYINGETFDASEIPLFLEGLQSEALFSRQTFGRLELAQHEEEKGRYVFSLKSVPQENIL
jgi:hypothetical protein